MVQVLPRVPTFAEQFSQALGQGAAQGLQNIPELAMRLAAQQRERQGSQAQSAMEQFKASVPNALPIQLGEIAEKASQLQGNPGEIQKQIADMINTQAESLSRLNEVHGRKSPSDVFGQLKELFEEGHVHGEKERIEEARAAAKGLDPRVARANLAKKGFTPEQIERAISKKSQSAKDILNNFSKEKRWETIGKRADEGRKNQLALNMMDILESNPNENLLLLRRAYEKRGVDWRDFKEVLLDLYDKDLIKLNHEQQNMLGDLQVPSEDVLTKVLKGFKLIKK